MDTLNQPDQTDDLAEKMLLFERNWAKSARRNRRNAGMRNRAIARYFQMNPVRYHQKLNALLDQPGIDEIDPVTVAYLRRIRRR